MAAAVRRVLLVMALAAVQATAAAALGAGVPVGGGSDSCIVKIDPQLYPTPGYAPEIPLKGMVAVVAGASRGIGLGAATVLHKAGATVIGTSRTPAEYSLPYPLLRLDVADAASVDSFVAEVLAHPAVQARGGVDILVVNPGRFVLGAIVLDTAGGAAAVDTYYSGLELSLRTMLLGNARLAAGLLPALEARQRSGGYARLVFTISPIGFSTGGFEPFSSFYFGYIAIKRAYLAFANSFRAALAARGSGVLVSTVNPQGTQTDLAKGRRPIFLQQVDERGDSSDPAFQTFLVTLRAGLAMALDREWVGSGYTQILSQRSPPDNVGVGAWDVQSRFRGQNDAIDITYTGEMIQSAFPFTCNASSGIGTGACGRGALEVAPAFLPTPGYSPEVPLKGRVAVITGASRGIGKAVALALHEAGAIVIGTSRTPADYGALPYPLLRLELADAASIDAFVSEVLAHPTVMARGGIDVLVNNAGRRALGGVLPREGDKPRYFGGILEVLHVNYLGHVRVTNALLPALDARHRAGGYARLLFTAAPGAYEVGGAEPRRSYDFAYVGSKKAVLSYANGLRQALPMFTQRSGVQVSTVSPMTTATDLVAENRPIFLESLNSTATAPGGGGLAAFLAQLRAEAAAGLDPAFVARAYVQILSSRSPPPNAAVGVAGAGSSAAFISRYTSDTQRSPYPFTCGAGHLAGAPSDPSAAAAALVLGAQQHILPALRHVYG